MNHVLLHALLFSALLSVTYPYIENIQLYEPMSTDGDKKDDTSDTPSSDTTPPITSMSSSTPPPPTM